MILSPKIYNKSYLLSEKTEGYREYKKNLLSPIRLEEIQLLKLAPKDRVLDIGCGRGDIVRYLHSRSYIFRGIDYSVEAIKISKSALPKKQKSWIILGDARKIKLPNNSFNKIIIGDVIEHMSFEDALKVINESYRLLKKNGTVVVHTAPNIWFKKYLYPVIRFIFIFMGKRVLVKKLDENISATHKYHMDEYSPRSLKNLLKKSMYKDYKVWVHPDVLRVSSNNYLNSIKTNFFFKAVSKLINKTPLIKLFGNDLLVVATKNN